MSIVHILKKQKEKCVYKKNILITYVLLCSLTIDFETKEKQLLEQTANGNMEAMYLLGLRAFFEEKFLTKNSIFWLCAVFVTYYLV